MRASPLCLGVGLSVACAARPQVEAAPPNGAASSAPTVEIPAASAAAPTQPAVSPSGPACVLQGAPWLPKDETAPLTVGPGGPAFVLAAVSTASIEVPVGDASTVIVHMKSGGWQLDGHLAAAAFSVYPLRLIEHDGFLQPSGFANLALERAEQGLLWLSAGHLRGVRPTAAPVPVAYACDEVTVSIPEPLDAEHLLAEEPYSLPRGLVRGASASDEVPLSREPGGAPVAWLLPGELGEVLVLEERGAHVRIALTNVTTVPFGWVERAALMMQPTDTEMSYVRCGLGTRSLKRSEAAEDQPVPLRCTAPVPVFARARGEVFRVGSIDARTPIVAERSGDAARLEPPEGFRLAEGATLETPTSGLVECRAAKQSEQPDSLPPPHRILIERRFPGE